MPRLFLLAALALSACTAPTTAQITHDMGGDLLEYTKTVRAEKASGLPVRVTGECGSACTYRLTNPNTCTTPSATWYFHGATQSGQLSVLGNGIMVLSYPPHILRNLPAECLQKTGGEYCTFSGETLIEWGVKRC